MTILIEGFTGIQDPLLQFVVISNCIIDPTVRFVL